MVFKSIKLIGPIDKGTAHHETTCGWIGFFEIVPGDEVLNSI